MTRQLTRLEIPFERMEAVTPDMISEIDQNYNWGSWERPLKETEKACFLSHVKAWEHVVSKNCHVLILEDDALLSRYAADIIDKVKGDGNVEHLTLEVRKRKKIIGKMGVSVSSGHHIHRLYQDRSGAAAYVLSPSGARKLLDRSRVQVALADALICKAYELKSFQVEPACAVQLDRAEAYGIEPPFRTVSLIDAGTPSSKTKRKFGFRARRIGAQLRMAGRALSCIGVAERREIRLDPHDFYQE